MKLKQLFCKHKYVYNDSIKITTNLYPYSCTYLRQDKCTKCGKLKILK